jgi:hypothetical protein
MHCGTCLYYRSYEDRISPASISTVLVEYCTMGNEGSCGYCKPACADYEPDQDYIDLMNSTTIEKDD